jgi:hypothetical protein
VALFLLASISTPTLLSYSPIVIWAYLSAGFIREAEQPFVPDPRKSGRENAIMYAWGPRYAPGIIAAGKRREARRAAPLKMSMTAEK